MANIIPFRGLRYGLTETKKLAKVMAPPYDVISNQQKRELKEADPHNVIRLIIGNPSYEKHRASDYQSAKETFAVWRKKGILKRDEDPSIYVYQQGFNIHGKTYRRTGFVALSQLTPFGNKRGGILAHEHTLSGPKADRLKLTKACRANFSCIFSLYPDKGGVGKVLKKITTQKADIIVDYPKDIENRVWKVSDAKVVKEVQGKIKGATLFIA